MRNRSMKLILVGMLAAVITAIGASTAAAHVVIPSQPQTQASQPAQHVQTPTVVSVGP